MHRVWQPAKQPPNVGRYIHLSDDGQRVMSAIYRHYTEEKLKLYTHDLPCLTSYPAESITSTPVLSSSFCKEMTSSNDSILSKTKRQNITPTVSLESRFPLEEKQSLRGKPSKTSNKLSLQPNQHSHLHVKLPNESSYSNLYNMNFNAPDITLAATNDINEKSKMESDNEKYYIPPVVDITSITEDLNTMKSYCVTEQQQQQNKKSILPDLISQKDKKECSVTKRLLEHQKIRVSMANTHRERKDSCKRQNTSCVINAESKKRIDQFFIPYKKQKQLFPEYNNPDTDDRIISQTDCTTNDIIHIIDVSPHERQKILDSVIKSKYILMTLVYSDGSTQLRENSCTQIKPQKKLMHTRAKSVTEVQHICIKYSKGTQDLLSGIKSPLLFFPLKLDNREISKDLWKFWCGLLSADAKKICFNSKEFLLTLLQTAEVEFCNVISNEVLNAVILDPLIASWLLDPDHPPVTFKQAISTVNLHQQNIDSKYATACNHHEDFNILSNLMDRLTEKLHSRELWKLFYCVETRLVGLLALLERTKIKVNLETFFTFSDVVKKKLLKLEKKAHEAAGHTFSVNSPAQLRQVLFEELKLDTKLPQKVKLARTNINHETSTSESVLTQLTPFHQLPAIILEYRQLQKMKSTYVDGMICCVKDGFLTTHWDQMSAATGRLSSYQPNIQAIPKTPLTITNYKDNYIVGKEMSTSVDIFARDPFVSHDGWSFIAADFQQIELRLLAHFVDDPILCQTFMKPDGFDIFSELTSHWYNKPTQDVTASEREQTKRVVYSVMYGAGKEKLADYLKTSVHNASAIMKSFLVRFPAVNQFTRKCVLFYQQNGFTRTIFKRRRMFPNICHPASHLRAQAERQAVNFCMQGSAADICKAAMLQVVQALKCEANIQARLLVQIHDELLFEVKDENLVEAQGIIKSVMENKDALCGDMVTLKVPLKVSVSVGKTWGHMTYVQQ